MVSKTEEEIAKENDLTDLNIVTRYKTAAEILSRCLTLVIDNIKPDATILSICKLADAFVTDQCDLIFTKITNKGVAFPCCLNQDNYLSNFAPFMGDKEASLVLKSGSLVRIALAAQVDGYVAHLTHTVIVPGSDVNNPIVDDLFAAAHFATEAVVRLMKPGNTNWMVTDAVNKVAKDFGVVAVEGFISGQIQRNTLEANKQIHLNPRPEDRSKADNACTFEVGEAYSVEILLSSGEGKSKTVESRTTIFRRDPEVKYSLKMAASRAVFSEIQTKFGDFGFSLEQLSDPVKAKLGITECVNHNILVSYPILVEKADALVVGVTFTVLLMANGLTRLTSMPVDFSKSLKSVKDEEILELLKTSVKPKKKNAKKAKDVVKEEVATAEI